MSNVHFIRAKTDTLTQHFVKKRCPNAQPAEIEHLIAKCRELGLDPTSDQTYLLITDPDDPDKRRARFMLGINGFRTVADRTGNYRGDGEEPVIERDRALVSAWNPKGIVKITAKVHVYSHGGWHAVSGTAYWDEYAPITPGPQGGSLASAWAAKPVILLSSVAEALAFRKAFPSQFSTVYAPPEFDAAVLGLKTPDDQPREEGPVFAPPPPILSSVSSNASSATHFEIDWLDGDIERVPAQIFEEKIGAWVNFWGGYAPLTERFWHRNRDTFVRFFHYDSRAHIELRRAIYNRCGLVF